ncbi:MAG: hypothetical protein ABIQ39_09315 [Ilumatobacteraceae bacterium]
MKEAPERVLPLVAFYAAASLVLESLRTPPDADVIQEWPDWRRRSWRQPGIHDIGDRLDGSSTDDKALEHLIDVLVEDRELAVPEWNGVVQVARQQFERDNSATVVLDGPVDLDADVVRWVVRVLDLNEPDSQQLAPSPRRSVEAILLAAVTGVLGA